MENKCINCTAETGRYPGCQDHCEHGIRLKKEREERKRKILKAKKAEALANDTTIKHCQKRRRKYNA